MGHREVCGQVSGTRGRCPAPQEQRRRRKRSQKSVWGHSHSIPTESHCHSLSRGTTGYNLGARKTNLTAEESLVTMQVRGSSTLSSNFMELKCMLQEYLLHPIFLPLFPFLLIYKTYKIDPQILFFIFLFFCLRQKKRKIKKTEKGKKADRWMDYQSPKRMENELCFDIFY